MPILIINGQAHGPYEKAGSAGPCEWCGMPLIARTGWIPTENMARNAQYIPDEAPTTHENQYYISTRLCKDCSKVYGAMFFNSIEESP